MDDDRRLIPWWPDAGHALGGLGRTSVYHLIKSGELPSVTIGRRRFVAVQDIDEYVEQRRLVGRAGGEAA
jgi:excisionase family DNA binding protein